MPDQAGIELILSAPNVKPIMESVIDDWKEINKQEKLATEQLERFNEEQAKQQQALKDIALGNQKIKDAMKELEAERRKAAKDTEDQIDRDLFAAEHQQKGIFGTIKAYFQQKAELKNLGKEIDSVNKQLRNLELRQESISLSARRGNASAIKEYDANAKAIERLSGKLSNLNEKYNVTGAKLELTKGKFAGLSKTFEIVKAGAIAVAATVALIGAAGLAAIVSLGKQNTVADKYFKQAGENFNKAKTTLSNALAPVAIIIAKIFDQLAVKLAKFLEDNAQAIHDWAIEAAKNIAGFVAYVGAAFDKIVNFAEQVIGTIRLVAAAADILKQGTFLQFGKAGNALDEFEKQFNEVKKLEADGKNLAAPGDAAKKAYDAAGESLKSFTLDFLTTSNITKKEAEELDALFKGLENANDKFLADRKKAIEEHKREVERLRAEYKRLNEELNKKIQEQDIKDAGPFSGVLLKADLAAKEIEAQGDLLVSVAKKLGKNQETINEIRKSVARISQAVIDDANKFLTDQADEVLGNIQKKLDELRAARTGTTEDLKFKNEIEAQFKLLDEFQQNVSARIEYAKKNGDDISGLITELERGSDIAIRLAQVTTLDFASKKAIEILEKNKKAVEDKAASLESANDKLKGVLAQLAGDTSSIAGEQRISINAQIKVNDVDLAVAKEQIRQFEESFKLFKETGVAGVVQTEAQIRVKIQQDQGITGIKPKAPSKDGKDAFGGTAKESPAITLSEGLDLAVGLNQIAFNTITDIALRSVDAQIEAIDRLNQARADSVDNLQEQLDREATFKANGLANDYAITKKQLDDAIKLQEDGAKKQEELNKKRAKIQQQQNDAETASSLITSVANIIKGWSTVPIVGTILGIAAATGMLISFASAKIQASKLARAYKGSRRVGETFGMLAPGEGYDDSPGVDRGLSVVDSKGRLRGFLGGDENINKQSVSRRHGKGLSYLNENEEKFKNINLLAMLKAMEASPMRPAFEFPDMSSTPKIDFARIVHKNEKLRERMVVVNHTPSISKEDLKEAVREVMKEQTDRMIDYHESRPDIIPNEWLKDYTERTSKSSKKKQSA